MATLLDQGPNLINPYALAKQQQRQQQQAALAHTQAQTDAETATAQREQQADAQKQSMNTMQGDALQWSMDPAHPEYKVQWNALPQEAKQHFVDAYPETRGAAPDVYNAAATQNGVAPNPVKIPGLQLHSATQKPNGEISFDSTAPVEKPPISQAQMNAAARMGVKTTPDMSQDDLQIAMADQAQQQQEARAQKDVFSEDAKKSNIINQTKRLVQNDPQVRNYKSATANYDSIASNVAKPARTGADDAFLAQAAATIEAPGRSPTSHDIAVFLQTRGLQGNADVIAGKIESLLNGADRNKAGRLFDDRTAQDIAAAAKNSLDTRRASLTETMTPHVNRMEDIGEDPYRHLPKSLVDDVYGVTQGGNIKSPQSFPTPSQQATEYLKSNPNLKQQFEQKYGPGSSSKILN